MIGGVHLSVAVIGREGHSGPDTTSYTVTMPHQHTVRVRTGLDLDDT
jgi:hypothetical protein